MLNRVFAFRWAALGIVFALPGILRAQTLADRLPADTMLYVGWQGTASPGPGYQDSNLKAVLSDSNLPAVFDEFLPKILDKIAHDDKETAEGVEVLRALLGPMWRHSTAIAFAGVEVDQKTGPRPKIILLCQAGDESAALKSKLSDLLKQGGAPPFPVNLLQKGDLIELVIGYDEPDTAVPAAGAKSLANNPEFLKSLSHVDKGAFLTAYVDFEKVMALADMAADMSGPEIQTNWRKARDMLGLKGVQRIISTDGFDGKEWASKVFIAAPAPRSGFVGSMLEARELSRELLAAIPENATIAAAVHFDVGGLVAAIRSAVSSFDPDVARQLDDAINDVNQAVGMDVQKDFLQSLGDEWAYYIDPTTAGNGIVGVTVVNRLRDAAKTESSLLKLEDFANKTLAKQVNDPKVTFSFRQAKIRGVKVHYLGIPLVTPAWAIADGNLYLGLYPEVVATAARRAGGKEKSISSNPAFVALRKRLGEHPVSSFGFIDLPRQAPENYSSWLVISHLANAGDLLGIPAPLEILPPLDKLMAHLSASGQITWSDADGFHFSGLSPFPGSELFASDPGSMSVAEASLMTSIMLPALNKVREEALKAKSANNLKIIGAVAMIYANDHDGKYPKDLGELFAGADVPIETFVSPYSNTAVPHGIALDDAKQWVRLHSDYVWNGSGKKNTMGADEPLAWENPAIGKRGVNILFGDGHVAFCPTAVAEQYIGKARVMPRGF